MLKVFGFSYSLNDIIIVTENLDDKIKVFGRIKRILFANDSIVFKLELYTNIIGFEKHVNSFKVVSSNEIIYKFFKNIIHKEPVVEIKISSNSFIQVRNFFYLLE